MNNIIKFTWNQRASQHKIVGYNTFQGHLFFFFNQGIVKQRSLNNRDATRDLNITIKLQFSNKKTKVSISPLL